MKRAVFLLTLAATALAHLPEETPTPTPPVDPKIDFKISLAGKQREFHIGEIIPIKLSFSSRQKNHYQIKEATYDRSGRMDYEHFIVMPTDGAEDPLAEYFSPDSVHLIGGHTPTEFLSTRPWTLPLSLNEWIRFTRAGEYKLRVSSHRVDRIEASSPHGTSPVTAVSNELTLKILPRDPEWEKRTCDQAVAILQGPSSTKKDTKGDSPALSAMERLRYLGTKEATRELAKRIRSGEGHFPTTCFFGLVSFPERAFALEVLEEELARPDRLIDDSFLDALIWLQGHDGHLDPKSKEGEEKALEKALRALQNKHDDICRSVFIRWLTMPGCEAENFCPTTIDRLIEQLLAIFDRLTPEQKHSLLSDRWGEIKRLALVPLLKRYAEQDSSSDPNQDIHYNARTIAALALRRWFELDPAGARPVVIAEISRAKPRFGVRDLGFLPDQSLPGVDRLLAEHFHGDEDFEIASNFASLIERYGTPEILPQVLQRLDANVGKWSCDVQNPLLSYVLRVDPAAARPRLEKAIARRDKENLCNDTFFVGIAVIHYDPLLEELAFRALDDPDHAFAESAAGMLAGFGSASAETELWKRYEKWCRHWAGREREVNLLAVAGPYVDGRVNELSFGRSLARAIADGNRWLTDEPKLQRLLAMSKVPTIQSDIQLWLEKWRPLSLVISSCGAANGRPPSDVWQADAFSADVAQHLNIDSLDKLKEKLSQFPPDTNFKLSLPWQKTDRGCIDELRSFLTSHQLSVTESKSDDGS